MKHYDYDTKGVCARRIAFDIEDGKLHNVKFTYGCDGNLKAIGRLVEGMETGKVVEILKGNQCGFKGTSCADQLAIAVEKAMTENA
ncbi:MAG: TIGR03905 family TSCPD domain-containing protein [Clostridia bacterium]|nr:TIGR03905 family TSCPD domain-containing protein [Clostridia bacterium]